MLENPQWEDLTVLVSPEILDYKEIHPKSVNGHELNNWKKIDLNSFLSQFGIDHWEMTVKFVVYCAAEFHESHPHCVNVIILCDN